MKNKVTTNQKKLSVYLLEHKFTYFFAILSMLIGVSLDMLSPQLTKRIIDDVIIGGQIDQLSILLIGVLSIGVGRCFFQYIKEYLFDTTGAHIMCTIRKDLFHHIQSLSADFFDRTNTGELMARVKDDVDRVWDAVTYVGMLMIEVVIHTSIVLFCMYRLHPKLAILPTLGMAITAFIALLMEKKLNGIYDAISEENAVLNTVAEENLAGVRTVKAFAREKFEIKKFLSHNKKYYELNMNQSKIFVTYYPYLAFITKLLPVLVLLVGGSMVMKDDLTLGSLGAFVEYSMNIVWPMEMLGWLTNGLSSAFASNRKIKDLYKETPSIIEKESPVVLDTVSGRIQFSNVHFHKADRQDILKDISFSVPAGKTIGIMGATGSGKSSIIYLLQRFYDVSQGAILIDGVDIRDMQLSQLRSSIAPVMQDVFLFSDTIRENVTLGKKNILNESAITNAAKQAQASSFIERMELQYDTVIGERGVGLSGGQKQRISIARALAKKNPILIFDDSTSALDMETEQLIQQTLNELHDTTKIIIAHRVSAVMYADEIIVLEDGAIVEQGTHAALLAQGGLYHKTYIAQFEGGLINAD